MTPSNRVCELFGIEKPIIQAGMVWCSGWRLASAVSAAGGLGLLGAGSMHPENLRDHIKKTRLATARPFGVNVPLLYPEIEALMKVIVEEKVPIVFTSAGNPSTWTSILKDQGMVVAHVVSSVKFAQKSQAAGVDAVVAEGFEAGGHNGREETTTFCLLPMVRESIDIPLMAAGGIGSGRAMLAAEVLGAEGFQIGTLFAACTESSAHENFKQRVIHSSEGDTLLTMKALTPVRLLKNSFAKKVMELEAAGASPEQLRDLLGNGRAKKGIFEGDMEEGELEIGQVAASIRHIRSAREILELLWDEYLGSKRKMAQT